MASLLAGALQTVLQPFGELLVEKPEQVLHFVAGTILALLGLCVRHGWWGLVASITLVALVGAGKELWDMRHPPHECSNLDFLADILGAAMVWAAYLLGRFPN